jgi:hypothetical protein
MKKLLLFAGVVVGLGIVCVVALTFFLGRIVTAGVNSFAPKVTQTNVTLASASISPLSGSGTLSGLVIGNPKGWSDGNICSLGKVHVSVAPFSILGDRIVINEVIIDAPEFNYETRLIASNVGDLLKNIEAAVGGGKGGGTQPATKDGKPIKFELKKFTLVNGKVRVSGGGSAATLPMPPISLTDLGTKEGGITPDQLVLVVMEDVTRSIVSAATKAAIDLRNPGAAAEGLKKTGDAIKGLFGGKK